MRKPKDTPKRIITKYQLKPGIWVAEVPAIRNGQEYKVTVRWATWSKLMDMGLYPNLTLANDGYVMAWSPTHKSYKRLVRLIADCNSDQQVTLKDGSELNLLEDNITVIDRDPAKWDREEFLTLDGGTYHNEIEYRTKL